MSLHVTKITSIGAVEDGDNPESRIMLFKNNPDRADTEEPTMAEPTIEGLQAIIVEKDAEIAALTPEPEVEVVVDESIQKQLDDKDAELAKMRADADEATALLEKERGDQVDVEIAATADKYTALLGDDAAPMLKTMHDTDVYPWLIEKLEHVQSVMATSDLFRELGVVDESDPVSQIAALAKEKQTDNPKLTDAQARALVRTERPDLKAAERQGA